MHKSNANAESGHGLPRKKPPSFIEEGTLLAKSNLLKRRVVQVIPAGWRWVISRERVEMAETQRKPIMPMIVHGQLGFDNLLLNLRPRGPSRLSFAFSGANRTVAMLKRQLGTGISSRGDAIKWFGAGRQFHDASRLRSRECLLPQYDASHHEEDPQQCDQPPDDHPLSLLKG